MWEWIKKLFGMVDVKDTLDTMADAIDTVEDIIEDVQEVFSEDKDKE